MFANVSSTEKRSRVFFNAAPVLCAAFSLVVWCDATWAQTPIATEPVVTPATDAASVPAEAVVVPAELPAAVAATEPAPTTEPTNTTEPTPSNSTDVDPQVAESVAQGPVTLRFAFSGASWREVLNWLADESNMALHVGDVPSGSFTYADPNSFTVDEAIARVNLFLIPQGFTIVRRQQLLSVISLGDPRSLQQLDAMATLTPVDQLGELNDHDVVKCIFPLGDIAADAAIAELKPLTLIITPVVLPGSNQLIVTDTAAKLRSVDMILRAMVKPSLENVVRRFELKHTDFETVMLVVRSHLGLAGTSLESGELSISTDLLGKRLFVSGVADKVDRLEQLLQVIDLPEEQSQSQATMTLRSFPVVGDNLQNVYDVLQTVLAGKSLRLSMDSTTKSIVALADQETLDQIEQTIAELQAPSIEFAVIPLNQLDPYFVVTLTTEMFNSKPDSKGNVPDLATAPRVDADPTNRQLFVRGTADQVAQIRRMVENLDKPATGGDSVRILPVGGRNRQQILEAASEYWRGGNRVMILPSLEAAGGEMEVIERALNPNPPAVDDNGSSLSRKPSSEPERTSRKSAASLSAAETRVAALDVTADNPFLAQASPAPIRTATQAASSSDCCNIEPLPTTVAAVINRNEKAPIRSRLVPQGIMIESDDLSALDEFQSHLIDIADYENKSSSPPVVYYLKYVNADDAVKMLADLLDGGQSISSAPSGTLVNGGVVTSTGTGTLGSLLLKREGVMTVTAGTATIVSDARLNRLIVQGTKEDVAVIEGYLKIVDKGTSLTTIETAGRAHVIELAYTKASVVAEAIEKAFVGRIAKDQNAAQANSRGGDRGESNERSSGGDNDRSRGGNDNAREPIEKPTRGRQAEMAIAVHEPSNSIIVTAPDALFAEVETLVRAIDQRSEQDIEVMTIGVGVDLETVMRTLGVNSAAASRSSASPSSSPSRNSDSSRSRQ